MNTSFQNPPGAAVVTLAQKAAWDRGFRIELRAKGSWLGFASTTAPGEVWIAGATPAGPGLRPVRSAGHHPAEAFGETARAPPGVHRPIGEPRS